MLQQTQVDRVVPYYKAFLKQFPNIKSLAEAPLSDVLRAWQGLGYNRRAKMLHNAAKVVVVNYGGRLPKTYSDLVSLPGVGDYTAKAVRTFAHNKPEVMIETNIRTVFIHHFFPKKDTIHDDALLPFIEQVLDTKNPAIWYAALMDYGVHLKKLHTNPSRKSAHHTKQKPFKGSDREIRGAILKAHLAGKSLINLPFDKQRLREQVNVLKREEFLG